MTVRIWDAPAFITAVEAVFEERGDRFQYKQPGEVKDCRYFDVDPDEPDSVTPGCLFGAALDRMGFGPAEVPEGHQASYVLVTLFGGVSLQIANAADAAQAMQDDGQPYAVVRRVWRKALR